MLDVAIRTAYRPMSSLANGRIIKGTGRGAFLPFYYAAMPQNSRTAQWTVDRVHADVTKRRDGKVRRMGPIAMYIHIIIALGLRDMRW